MPADRHDRTQCHRNPRFPSKMGGQDPATMAIQVRGGLSAPMIALDWGMTVPRRHAKPDGRDGDETQIRKFCCRVRELQSSRSSANQTLGTTRTSTPRPQPTTAAAATPSSATSTPVPAVSSATSATSSTLPLDECLHSRQPDHPPSVLQVLRTAGLSGAISPRACPRAATRRFST